MTSEGSSDMQVADVMSREVVWIYPDTSLSEAARRMRDLNVGCLPVVEHDRLVGIVTDCDMVCRALAEDRAAGTCVVREIMPKGLTCCFEDLIAAGQLMEQKPNSPSPCHEQT
jgi:CBS domain-containing protein